MVKKKIVKVFCFVCVFSILLFVTSIFASAVYPAGIPAPDCPSQYPYYMLVYNSKFGREGYWLFYLPVANYYLSTSNYFECSDCPITYKRCVVSNGEWVVIDDVVSGNHVGFDFKSIVYSNFTIYSDANCSSVLHEADEVYSETETTTSSNKNTIEQFTDENGNIYYSFDGGYDGLDSETETGFWNTLTDYVREIRDKVVTFPDDFADHVLCIIDEINMYLLDIWTNFDTSLATAFRGLNTTINNFKNELFDKMDYYFNPNSEQLDTDFGTHMSTSITEKMPFLDDLGSSISSLGASSSPMTITKNITFGQFTMPFTVDFSWYEPHRVTIRNAIGTIFSVLTLLAIVRSFLSVFNIHMGGGMTLGGIHALGSEHTTLSDAELHSNKSLAGSSETVTDSYSEPILDSGGNRVGSRTHNYTTTVSSETSSVGNSSSKSHSKRG